MPVGFLRGGSIDTELRDSILEVLRRGPHEFQELFRFVRESLDRPALRPTQMQPVILRLSDKGLVKVSGRGSNKTVALTLKGHEASERNSEEHEGPERIDSLLKLRLTRSGPDEIDDDGRRQIARIVSRACARSGLSQPDELAIAAAPDD